MAYVLGDHPVEVLGSEPQSYFIVHTQDIGVTF